MGGERRRGHWGSQSWGAGEPVIVYGPTEFGVTPTQERDKGQGAGLRSRAVFVNPSPLECC
jgi:hypothetical protein